MHIFQQKICKQMDDNEEELSIPEQPEEELRLENDILKLKLQAEFGAQFDDIPGDVSPEMEQQFLKQVYDFEKAWENQETTTVGKLLGNPVFKPLSEIPADELENEWEAVKKLYETNNISLDFTHEYPTSEKYRFATTELPLHETMFVSIPGMMLGFIYEEFHPNHAADMEDMVNKFLEGWFEQDAEKCISTIGQHIILPHGSLMDPGELEGKLQLVFDSYASLEETEFFISETSYDKQQDEEEELLMLGYTEGAIHWNAILENGEILPFAGPFKFYLEYNGNSWAIMYFVIPGWKW